MNRLLCCQTLDHQHTAGAYENLKHVAEEGGPGGLVLVCLGSSNQLLGGRARGLDVKLNLPGADA